VAGPSSRWSAKGSRRPKEGAGSHAIELKQLTDEAFAKRLVDDAGNADLQAEAYRRYFPRLQRCAHSHPKRWLGFDAVHDTLTRVLLSERLRDVQPNAVFSFLKTSCSNAVIDSIRRDARSVSVKEIEFVAAERSDGARDAVEDALARIAPDEVEVLRLRFLRGLSIAEIASTLGISYAAAAQRLSRATKRARGD
jgi:RNA polymerase sigma factor (sigma-70 family)